MAIGEDFAFNQEDAVGVGDRGMNGKVAANDKHDTGIAHTFPIIGDCDGVIEE
mgnify:CR=1 FL=1